MKSFPKPRMEQWMAAASGALLIVALLGCATVQPAKTSMAIASDPEPKITLGPGDVLDIKFYYAPELNEHQTVRPDGKITLQLLGDVDVQGKTPSELRDGLLRFYTTQLKKPEIAVIVRSLNERRIYVGGEVRTPSLLPLPGRLTALEAIMQAGGFNLQTAELKNVVIIRQRDGKHYGTVLDFQDVLKGKDERTFYLEPRDIVYVPRTKIADLNQWVEQYITKMVPQVGLIYTRPLGDGTVGIGPR